MDKVEITWRLIMRRRIVWSRLLILSFGLLFGFDGTNSSFGQSQPCPGCYPPSTVAPTSTQSSGPTYPGNQYPSPGYPISGAPQTSASGWTVPVPNRFSVTQSGQVVF